MNFQANNNISYQLVTETLQCNFSLQKINETSVKIIWDIPVDANNGTNIAYNGVVIVASHKPQKILLTNQQSYVDDPTTNVDLHVGDKVGIDSQGLVVFSVTDKTTKECTIESSFDVYFYAYVKDRHLNYTPFAVSLNYSNNKLYNLRDASNGFHLLQIKDKTITDLVEYQTVPNTTESVEIDINFPPVTITHNYNTTGLTYEDFILNFNTYAKQYSADFQGAIPVNTGTYWLNNNLVYFWDGYSFTPRITYVQPTQPHIVADGVIWKSNNDFKIRQNPVWNTLNVLQKPTLTTTTADFWYNGTEIYKWEGNIWVEHDLYNQITQPGLPDFEDLDGKYWLDNVNNTLYHIENNRLIKKTAISSDVDPLLLPLNYYWVNLKDKTLKQLGTLGWEDRDVTIGTDCIPENITTRFYFDKTSNQLFDMLLDVELLDFIVFSTDPLLLPSYSLWFKNDTDELFINNNGTWIDCELIISNNNPLIEEEMDIGTVWYDNNVFKIFEGTWNIITPITSITDPNTVSINEYVYETTTNVLYIKTLTSFDEVPFIDNIADPTIAILGETWLNGATLSVWNGTAYTPIIYTLNDPTPSTDFKWFDNVNNILYVWNGIEYVETIPDFEIVWDDGLKLINNTTGSDSVVVWKKYLPIKGVLINPTFGGDAVSAERMQREIGVGGHENDISDRIDTIEYIKRTLGAPTNVVELTEAQLNDCIDSALRTLRLYSSASLDKKVALMELKPNQSTYILSNRKFNYHKIVDVMQIHRLPSSFLTSVGSSQIYGQLVLQQLYRAGSFDLVSYHMIANYIELMEHMFASKIQFLWKERTRELTMYNVTGRTEIVLLECAVERTENDLLTDRRTEDWIKRWSCAEARERLAEIRGKFTSLPGAGGGISLNVSDLIQKASEEKERCITEIKNYIVDSPEHFGGHAAFVLG